MCDLTLDFICTYKLLESGECVSDDSVSSQCEPDEIGISDLMYNIQYLQTFGLTEFQEDIINYKMVALYDKMKGESFMQELFQSHPYKENMTNEIMFRTLFSYDYLDITHKLLYNYFHGLSVDNNITKLKDKLLESNK